MKNIVLAMRVNAAGAKQEPNRLAYTKTDTAVFSKYRCRLTEEMITIQLQEERELPVSSTRINRRCKNF